MSTPGSTWATHSFGSLSSTNNTTGSTRRPLAELGVPSPLELDIPFSLASISFPQTLVPEFELPVLLYDHRNFSDSASDSPITLSRLCAWLAAVVDVGGPVHGLQFLYAPDAFNAMSLSCENKNDGIAPRN